MSGTVQKRTETMVVVGSHGVGKATLIGNLMYKCGGIDMLLHEKMQKEGIHKFDQLTEYCKKHGIKPSFEAKHATISFIEDTKGTYRPDYLIYMIDAAANTPPENLTMGAMEATRIITVVNKMDACDWSEASYTQALQSAASQLDDLGLSLNNHPVLPISALYGDNVLETSTKSPWFSSDSSQQKTLMEAINAAAGGPH